MLSMRSSRDRCLNKLRGNLSMLGGKLNLKGKYFEPGIWWPLFDVFVDGFFSVKMSCFEGMD